MSKDSVYIPAEDTFLLANEAQKYTVNSSLEMGVGSGYLTAELAQQVEHFIGTYIDPEAIKQVRERLEIEGLDGKVDLVCCSAAEAFSDRSFDLVVFNPRYNDFQNFPVTLRPEDPLIRLIIKPHFLGGPLDGSYYDGFGNSSVAHSRSRVPCEYDLYSSGLVLEH